MDISKSTALVTGANRGLGKALARELLARGAKVYAGARDPSTVDLSDAIAIPLDITDHASIARAAGAAPDVTLLVNNAGTYATADLLDGDIDEIRIAMETNCFGPLLVTRAFAPVIKINGGGAILNILSYAAWLSRVPNAAYSAAKAAEWSMTNALRIRLAPDNVRVIGLYSGAIDTAMIEHYTGPKADPTDIAKIAIDGVATDAYEILADEDTREVQAMLAGGVLALYPTLFE